MVAVAVINEQRIKATGRHVVQLRQIMLCGADQLLLFAGIDAGSSASVIRPAALPDFDENQYAAVLHDQIDLAKTAAIVMRDQLQSLALQKFRSQLFRIWPLHGLKVTGASTDEAFLN